MGDDEDLRRRLDLLGSRIDVLKALEVQRQAHQADKPLVQRPPTQWVDPAYRTRASLTPPERAAGMIILIVMALLLEWLWPK
ncbi:hypothetical protein ACHMW7_07570 [Aminobacter sp. UC22_36]|uniref:hypothetical protein n=1 Tax=Aminobacter sp. UC22_36 TaxID=3374549 RepID=UPI003757657C